MRTKRSKRRKEIADVCLPKSFGWNIGVKITCDMCVFRGEEEGRCKFAEREELK